MSRVMIVEDERVLAKNLSEKLRAHGNDVLHAANAKDALAECGRFAPDVVLLDIRLPDANGLEVLPKLKAEAAGAGIIVMTAHGNERIAVDAMKAGALEYLTKPIDLDELLLTVNRAVEHQQIRENLRVLREQEGGQSGIERIIGESAATKALRETLTRLTRTEVFGLPDAPTILITGETGTGKDLVARAIHYSGPRAAKPFIHVNCTALPESLFESELFGHMRGAFTSAAQAKRGLFEVAQDGTIFLDEIGHLDMGMQAKLLHAIENRQIRPVGGTDARAIDVHIVAATNRDLAAAVEAGEFRRDLYHRLHVIEIQLESLRNRPEDIPPLANHFLSLHCRRFGLPNKRIGLDAMRAMSKQPWKGNVRELSHVIESAVLRVDHEVMTVDDLGMATDGCADLRVYLPGGRSIAVDFERGEPKLDEIEHTILTAAFEYTGHNLSRAARILGITREALRYRMNRMAESGREAGY